jgi:hypothetical protein
MGVNLVVGADIHNVALHEGCYRYTLIPNLSLAWVSVFHEQTVERQGSLAFCISKSFEAEHERRSPLERMSVFAGNARHLCFF